MLFEEALALYRALAAQNAHNYWPDLAMPLDNLGELSRAENRNAEARKDFEEALAILRSRPTRYAEFYLARTLNNLGNLNANENRKAEAREDYNVALGIYRWLVIENHDDVHRPDVAMTLNNFGLLSRAENRNAEARTHTTRPWPSTASSLRATGHEPAMYQPYVQTVEQDVRDLGLKTP